ncbi:hypothetical protein C8R44DRAFT_868100 [Mycena epipterygia]|nr:hypothetical protein C8R44DRAFT_868100 [Mycena epipterygia]
MDSIRIVPFPPNDYFLPRTQHARRKDHKVCSRLCLCLRLSVPRPLARVNPACRLHLASSAALPTNARTSVLGKHPLRVQRLLPPAPPVRGRAELRCGRDGVMGARGGATAVVSEYEGGRTGAGVAMGGNGYSTVGYAGDGAPQTSGACKWGGCGGEGERAETPQWVCAGVGDDVVLDLHVLRGGRTE